MPNRPPYLAAGPRVAVRHLLPGDAEEFTTRARESAALHHPWLFLPETAGEYGRWSAKFATDTSEGFAVCDPADGSIAAAIAINNIVRGGFQCGALGYGAFAHAARRGLMTEGLALVVRHAFGPLGLHRLEANIQPGNEASRGLVQRLGFRLEGFSPDFLHIGGAWRDHERWAITAEMCPQSPDRA
ncbi:GNAT family N-acetyltransferase [Streptomyces pathocidini]|uniref:GNAT family N-acetyltransferase n=1 Tax=Streptomyces pathocidini TaxID=1650571 RepID=A0ABW7UNF3_9ACTN|nr:GNAT family protein [Streptomyces pathocidini]